MNHRTGLAFVLGVWCGATVFMWFVATQNFRVVEWIVEARSTEFANLTSGIASEDLRQALRYQASEVNRLFFNGWGTVQPLLGLAAVLLAWRAERGRLVLLCVVAMMLIAVFLQVYVVPETVRLGRMLDFVPREPEAPQAAAFWRLHHTYTALDMLKFAIGLGAAFLLTRERKPDPEVASEPEPETVQPEI